MQSILDLWYMIDNILYVLYGSFRSTHSRVIEDFQLVLTLIGGECDFVIFALDQLKTKQYYKFTIINTWHTILMNII